MKVKIESDGTRQGTRIFDAETGESLEGLHVYGVKWEIPPSGEAQPICLLTCRSTNVDLVVDAGVELMPPRSPGGGDQNL